MPVIRYYLCANRRCRRPINRAGADVTALDTVGAILTASVRTADGYRCPDCVTGRSSLASRHPKVAISPCGNLYPSAESISQMVETPAWLEDYIQRTAKDEPKVYMAMGINGGSRPKSNGRRPAADSRQPALTSGQKAALARMLSGDAECSSDSLMSLLT